MTVVYETPAPDRSKKPYRHEAKPLPDGGWADMGRRYRFKWVAILDAWWLSLAGLCSYRVVKEEA